MKNSASFFSNLMDIYGLLDDTQELNIPDSKCNRYLGEMVLNCRYLIEAYTDYIKTVCNVRKSDND